MSTDMGKFSRRQALAGATVSLAGLGNNANARVMRDSHFNTSIPLTLSTVETIQKQTTYDELKVSLMGLGKFDWIKGFDEPAYVDKIVRETISPIFAMEPPFDPYQIEELISSVSALLDRCLINRRELYDLEEKAVRRALEYQLFEEQTAAQFLIELSDGTEDQRSAEGEAQNSAATQFVGDMGAGFAALARASAASSKASAAIEKSRKEAVRAKWNSFVSNQHHLQLRHISRGNALNYGERRDRIIPYFKQDVALAFKKLKCAIRGANQIFGLSIDELEPNSEHMLDDMVVKTREMLELLELKTQDEIDFEHVVHLRQLRTLKLKPVETSQRVTDAYWSTTLDAADGNGLISFSLSNEFSTAFKRIRIKAIGISVLWDVPADANQRLRTCAAVLFPPPVPNLFSAGSIKLRQPVLFERISGYEPGNIRMFSLPQVSNIDPRSGQWQLQVSSNVIMPDGAAHVRDGRNIRDLKIHMRLSAIVDNAPDKWSDMSF